MIFVWLYSLMRNNITEELILQARSRSLSVAVWTVNNETGMLGVCIYLSYLFVLFVPSPLPSLLPYSLCDRP